jgi:hypothetical protein
MQQFFTNGKYFAPYFEMLTRKGAKSLKYVSFKMNMMFWDLLSLVDLDALYTGYGWRKVILQVKSFVLNRKELETEKEADQAELVRRVRGGRRMGWM